MEEITENANTDVSRVEQNTTTNSPKRTQDLAQEIRCLKERLMGMSLKYEQLRADHHIARKNCTNWEKRWTKANVKEAQHKAKLDTIRKVLASTKSDKYKVGQIMDII